MRSLQFLLTRFYVVIYVLDAIILMDKIITFLCEYFFLRQFYYKRKRERNSKILRFTSIHWKRWMRCTWKVDCRKLLPKLRTSSKIGMKLQLRRVLCMWGSLIGAVTRHAGIYLTICYGWLYICRRPIGGRHLTRYTLAKRLVSNEFIEMNKRL